MKKEAYTEWKYFTLFCNDGTKVAGALSRSSDDCDVWLSVYGAKVIMLQEYYGLDKFSSPAPGCFKVNRSFISKDNGSLSLCVNEKDVELRVNAKSLVDWRNNKMEHKIKDSRAEWEVPALKMSFEGSLTVDGETRTISGLMFHDQVRHNLTPSPDTIKNMRSWLWGILYSKSYSILFVDVDYKPNPFRFLCVNDPRGTVSSNDSIKPEDFKLKVPRKLPHGMLEITYRGDAINVGVLRSHDVVHNKGLSKLVHRVLKLKTHCIGKFSFRGEEGEAYIESFKLR